MPAAPLRGRSISYLTGHKIDLKIYMGYGKSKKKSKRKKISEKEQARVSSRKRAGKKQTKESKQ